MAEWVQISIQCFKQIESFPKDEKYGLSSQTTKAAVSITSKIAEGSSRTFEKDYHRFLEIALGSAFEFETQILIAKALNFGKEAVRDNIMQLLQEEQKMFISFMEKLEK